MEPLRFPWWSYPIREPRRAQRAGRPSPAVMERRELARTSRKRSRR